MINYGIQNEKSHIRAHVCPVVRRIYTYKTASGLDAITSGKYRTAKGYQDGVPFATAEGYLVPPFDISGCVALSIPDRVWEYIKFSQDETTTEKGHKAEKLVLQMVRKGLFPIPAIAEAALGEDIQISGCDIIIKGNGITHDDIIIQVKCDYPGGDKNLGGTGNLFLQIAELNPLMHH